MEVNEERVKDATDKSIMVGELIRLLSKMPLDAVVLTEGCDCWGIASTVERLTHDKAVFDQTFGGVRRVDVRDPKSRREPMTPRQVANVLRVAAHEMGYTGLSNEPGHEDSFDELFKNEVHSEYMRLADVFDRYDNVDHHGQMNALADMVKKGKSPW